MCSSENYMLSFNIQFDANRVECNVQISNEIYNLLSKSSVYIDSIDNNTITINDDFFSTNSIVEDEKRYYLKISKGKIIEKKSIDTNEVYTGMKNIVLLLESPHKSEYRDRNIYDRLIPIAPAQGSKKGDAGGAIAHYLDKAIEYISQNNKGLLKDGEYILIISNPVQFQTSLSFIHNKGLKGKIKKLRDDVWKAIWDINHIQTNFKNRIDQYSPDLIINACTKNLKMDVNVMLNNIDYKPVLINHPAYNWIQNKF